MNNNDYYDFYYSYDTRLLKFPIKNDGFHAVKIQVETAKTIDFSSGVGKIEEVLLINCLALKKIIWPDSTASILRLKIVGADHLTLLDVSPLTNLQELSIVCCGKLTQIQGISASLKKLHVHESGFDIKKISLPKELEVLTGAMPNAISLTSRENDIETVIQQHGYKKSGGREIRLFITLLGVSSYDFPSVSRNVKNEIHQELANAPGNASVKNLSSVSEDVASAKLVDHAASLFSQAKYGQPSEQEPEKQATISTGSNTLFQSANSVSDALSIANISDLEFEQILLKVENFKRLRLAESARLQYQHLLRYILKMIAERKVNKSLLVGDAKKILNTIFTQLAIQQKMQQRVPVDHGKKSRLVQPLSPHTQTNKPKTQKKMNEAKNEIKSADIFPTRNSITKEARAQYTNLFASVHKPSKIAIEEISKGDKAKLIETPESSRALLSQPTLPNFNIFELVDSAPSGNQLGLLKQSKLPNMNIFEVIDHVESVKAALNVEQSPTDDESADTLLNASRAISDAMQNLSKALESTILDAVLQSCLQTIAPSVEEADRQLFEQELQSAFTESKARQQMIDELIAYKTRFISEHRVTSDGNAMFGTGFKAGLHQARSQILQTLIDSLQANRVMPRDQVEANIKELMKDGQFKARFNDQADLLRRQLLTTKRSQQLKK